PGGPGGGPGSRGPAAPPGPPRVKAPASATGRDLPRPAGRPVCRLVAITLARIICVPHVAAYPPGRVHRAVPPNQNRQAAVRQPMAALVLPMSNDLTVNEESIGFYCELGRAITAWAHVELSLSWVVSACFTKHNAVQTAHGFSSIESFRSKLQFADRVFKSRHWPQKHMKKWDELYAQMEKQARLRNKLA